MTRAWVILVGSTNAEEVEYSKVLREHNTEFDDVLPRDFWIVGAPNTKRFSALNTFASMLRVVFPSDIFYFSIPNVWQDEFRAYMIGRFGERSSMHTAGGFADIEHGIGFGRREPLMDDGQVPAPSNTTIKHELAHLHNCGSWHDAHGENVGHPLCRECLVIKKYPGAEKYPWCRQEV